MVKLNDCLNVVMLGYGEGKRVSAAAYIRGNCKRFQSGKWRTNHNAPAGNAIIEEVEQECKLSLWMAYETEDIDENDPEVKLILKRCIDRVIQREHREQVHSGHNLRREV